MDNTVYICQLSEQTKNKIKQNLTDLSEEIFLGMDNMDTDIEKEIELAMNGRLCDLENVIDTWKYLKMEKENQL